MVITTEYLHSTKPAIMFRADSNTACGLLEIRDGENLRQWFRLLIRLNAFYRSNIPHNNSSLLSSSSAAAAVAAHCGQILSKISSSNSSFLLSCFRYLCKVANLVDVGSLNICLIFDLSVKQFLNQMCNTLLL